MSESQGASNTVTTGASGAVERRNAGRRTGGLRCALATAALWLAACASSGSGDREGDWAEADFNVASERVLRQVATLALEKNGFPPGTEEVGAKSTVSSGWRVELQPFKGDGTRSKAHVQYEEKGAAQWHVYVRVEKETNEELAKPLELARAKWESAPDDRDAAARIVRYMQTVFGREFQMGPKNNPAAMGPAGGG